MLSFASKTTVSALLRPSKTFFWATCLRYNSTQAAPQQTTPAAAKPKFVSLAPAGTKLKGLNILKGQDPIVALADEEYPAWLWEVLDKEAQKKKLEDDPVKSAQKARRNANRQKIKENNFLAAMSK